MTVVRTKWPSSGVDDIATTQCSREGQSFHVDMIPPHGGVNNTHHPSRIAIEIQLGCLVKNIDKQRTSRAEEIDCRVLTAIPGLASKDQCIGKIHLNMCAICPLYDELLESEIGIRLQHVFGHDSGSNDAVATESSDCGYGMICAGIESHFILWTRASAISLCPLARGCSGGRTSRTVGRSFGGLELAIRTLLAYPPGASQSLSARGNAAAQMEVRSGEGAVLVVF